MEKTIEKLMQNGASEGMAAFMTATAKGKRYRAYVEYWRYGDENKGESYTVETGRDEGKIADSLEEAIDEQRQLKRAAKDVDAFKDEGRSSGIAVSSDGGKTWTGTYFYGRF